VTRVAPPTAALAVPSAFASILRERAYRRLWCSGLCVNAARWMDLVLLGWLAFQLTDSPFMVGLAAFARSAPLMALGPFTGILADRLHRGRVLVFTQALGLATALGLAAVFAMGRGGFWPLVGLEALFGALWAIDFPARRTALYALVGSRRVATAVSLETVSMQVAKMIGPVAAGIGLARVGPAPCYLAIAVLYALGLLAFIGLPPRIGGPGPRDTTSMAASLGAGFREAWRAPTMRAVLVVTILMNVLFFPYQHMLPVFARDVLGVGPEWLGALIAADGLGALLGALAIASRRGFLPHGRLFALGLPASAGGDRRLRVGLRGHAEHAGAARRPRGQPRAGDGHPLGLHRDPAGGHALDRLSLGRNRRAGGDGDQRDGRAPGHVAGGVAPGAGRTSDDILTGFTKYPRFVARAPGRRDGPGGSRPVFRRPGGIER
jgi:MFS family permease